MNLSEITASPTVVEIDGTKFKVSPMRDKDFGDFESWVRSHYLNVVKSNLGGLSDEDRQRQLDRAFDYAPKITITSPEALQVMMTIDGAAELLYLSLRREQPDITYEDCQNIVTDEKKLTRFMDAINEVNDQAFFDRPKRKTTRRKSAATKSPKRKAKRKAAKAAKKRNRS